MRNKFKTNCEICDETVDKKEGICFKNIDKWMVICARCDSLLKRLHPNLGKAMEVYEKHNKYKN